MAPPAAPDILRTFASVTATPVPGEARQFQGGVRKQEGRADVV